MSYGTEDTGEKNAVEERPSFVPAKSQAKAGPPRNGKGVSQLEFLLDIPLELRVEVGRTIMTMGDLAKAQAGTVIELNRPSGESLDILANGKLVARGEAVLVGDRYGVRILEVIGMGTDSGEVA
jgi:flagellar motor switch protein FliN/FliY